MSKEQTDEEPLDVEWKCRKPYDEPVIEEFAQLVDSHINWAVMAYMSQGLHGTDEARATFMEGMKERSREQRKKTLEIREADMKHHRLVIAVGTHWHKLCEDLGIDLEGLYS